LLHIQEIANVGLKEVLRWLIVLIERDLKISIKNKSSSHFYLANVGNAQTVTDSLAWQVAQINQLFVLIISLRFLELASAFTRSTVFVVCCTSPKQMNLNWN
jgi:hypothetical protein